MLIFNCLKTKYFVIKVRRVESHVVTTELDTSFFSPFFEFYLNASDCFRKFQTWTPSKMVDRVSKLLEPSGVIIKLRVRVNIGANIGAR